MKNIILIGHNDNSGEQFMDSNCNLYYRTGNLLTIFEGGNDYEEQNEGLSEDYRRGNAQSYLRNEHNF